MTPTAPSSRVARPGLMWLIGGPLFAFFFIGGLLFWWFLPSIGIGQIWVAVSLVQLVIFGAISSRMNKNRAAKERLMKEGLRGMAEVIEVEPTGVMVNYRPQVRLRLRVLLPGKPPYEVEHREILPILGADSLAPQRRVGVIVDKADPKKLMIDWSARIASPAPGPVSAAARGSVGAADRGQSTGTLAERLEQLKSLRQRNLISETEFETHRQRLLSEL